MLKFVILSALALTSCTAVPYGYGQPQPAAAYYQSQPVQSVSKLPHPATTGYGHGNIMKTNSFFPPAGTQASPSGYSSGYGASQASYGAPNNNYGLLTVRQGQTFEPTVTAAVQQLGRTVEYRVIPYQDAPIQPQVIEIEPSDNPVHLHFKTRSSTLSLSQSHTPGVPQQYEAKTEVDQPQRLSINIEKPVIQEVFEKLSPYRQVTQEINPVQESLHTIVTKGEGQRAQYTGGANYGSSSSSQYGSSNQQYAYAQPAKQATSYTKQTTAYKPLPSLSLQTNYPAPAPAPAEPTSAEADSGY